MGRERKPKHWRPKEEARPSRRERKAQRDPDAPLPVPRTVESVSRVDPSVEALPDAVLEDISSVFGPFLDGSAGAPRCLITTTRRAHRPCFEFAEELVDLFPGSELHRREGHHGWSEVVEQASAKGFSHLLLVNEIAGKQVEGLSITRLPAGPTATFHLTSIQLSKLIHRHGRSSSHTPELILNNFNSKLGQTVGKLFVTLFPPVPQFTGRQVVTLHNQRDFIFVRRHRYIFEEQTGKRVRLQEIGPRFTLKLRAVHAGAVEWSKPEKALWLWKSHATDSKAFAL